MRVMYDSVCDKFKFKLSRNLIIGCNGSKSVMTMNTYNSFEDDIHKDIAVSGGTFILVIDSQREGHS